MKTVIILGASPKEDRYSHKAQKLLMEHGYEVVPVNPAYSEILGVKVKGSLDQCPRDPWTLTLYMGPRHFKPLVPEILKLNPARVIFNPGTEDEEIMDSLRKGGIGVQKACTLVLLNTGQFERTDLDSKEQVVKNSIYE